MHCPNCGLANPDTAKFCANCGTALGAAAGSFHSSQGPPPPPPPPYQAPPQGGPYRPPQAASTTDVFTPRNIALGCLLLVLLVFFMGFVSCMRGCGRHSYYRHGRTRVYRRY